MAQAALASAHGHLGALVARDATRVQLCVSRERPGMPDEAARAVERLVGKLGATKRFFGDAGAFAALREGAAAIAAAEARLVVTLAVDSFVTPASIEERLLARPSTWDLDPPPPSEGAAAIALMDAHQARRDGIPVLGLLEGAAVAIGAANDDNDDPVDGAAMGVALKQLPDKRARSAFGPFKVDLLRRDEWQLATARAGDRFAAGSIFTCLESKVGRLGAASGLANAAYGVAVLRHAACERPDASGAPCYAWAISPDGTRGVAMLTGGAR
jgi:3-oxoacyl-(acyl-carrier-protein) synthase